MSNVRKLFTQCILLAAVNYHRQDLLVHLISQLTGATNTFVQTEEEESEGNLVKEDNSVCCDRLRMPFDSVYDRVEDFKTTAYDFSLSSLTKKALQGESAICILCGDHNETNWKVLLRACVTELLEEAGESERKVGVIKLCWFTVGADGAETLVDILKAPSTTPVFSCAHKSIELVMRELSGGRGVTVPGIVEMELNTIADLEKVFDHAHSFSPGIFTDTTVHSIVQLSFTDKRKVEAVRMRKKDFVAQGALRDPPGLGRITFLQLSNLRSQGPKSVPTTPMGMSPQRMQYPLPPTRTTLLTKIEPPSEPVKIDFVTEAGGFYPWIEHSRQVLQWMENKRASTPFHRSRLLLLLKDVLLRRQPATMLLCLRPSVAQLSHHEDWLRVAWLLSRDFAPLPIAITPSASPAVRKYNPYGRHESENPAPDHNNGDNVETASVTWVFPGEDDSTVNSHSAYSSSPEHASPPGILKGQSKGSSSPGYTDSIHWRAAMRARATDYARAHSPRRRGSRSSSRSHSRRPSRTESPRSPSETSISPQTPNLTNPTSRSRVNSLDSRVHSLDGSVVEAGWDRTTTPGRSSSRHRVRLQLQTEFSPHNHHVNNDSPDFAYATYDNQAGQENTTISPPPSTLSSAVSSGTPSAMAHQRRFFRSTLERIEGQIFEGAHGTAPVPSPKRTKPVSPKPRVKHLTSKEMSAAMRVLANRNKKLVATAAKDKDDLLGAHVDTNTTHDCNSGAASTAEVEDLKKRLAEAQGRCTTLETEQGVPLTYPTYDPTLFYTKWGPISPSKRRASVQTFLQARGAAIDHSTDAMMLPVVTTVSGNISSRSQDNVHQTVLDDAAFGSRAESNDSRDGEEGQNQTKGRTTMRRVFGEVPEENDKGPAVGEHDHEEEEIETEERHYVQYERKSVEEQLREALESLRVLGIKYEDLERKYNALLAARSAQQMQNNPMSASRPSSTRLSLVSPSPPTLIQSTAPPPIRSSLTALFPPSENAPGDQQLPEVSKAVASVSVSATSMPVAEDRNVSGAGTTLEKPSVSQKLISESLTAVHVHAPEENNKSNPENTGFASKEKLKADCNRPPLAAESTTVEVASAPSPAIAAVPVAILPEAIPSADSSPVVTVERRSSALARTSIRTSPIPSDSIPSVSPIRFQRTRRAPREPVATPFVSSFQATDYANEHDPVFGASAWVSAEDVPTAQTVMEEDVEGRSMFTDTNRPSAVSPLLEKDTASAEATKAQSVNAEAAEVPPTELLSSVSVPDQDIAPLPHALHAETVSESPMAENEHIYITPSDAEDISSPEPVMAQSASEKIRPARSEEFCSSSVGVASQKNIEAVETVDSKLEYSVEQRPISTRLPFIPKYVESPQDKDKLLSPFESLDTPADQIQDAASFEKVITPARVNEPPSAWPSPSPLSPAAGTVLPSVPKVLSDRSLHTVAATAHPELEKEKEKEVPKGKTRTVSFSMPPPLPPPPPAIVTLSSPHIVSKVSLPEVPSLPPPVKVKAVAAVDDAAMASEIISTENTSQAAAVNVVETTDEILEEEFVHTEEAQTRPVLPNPPARPLVAPPPPSLTVPAVVETDLTTEGNVIEDELAVPVPGCLDPSASPELAKPHLRMSISKTKVPQFLLYRHSDSEDDDEGEQETLFPASFGATWEKNPDASLESEDEGVGGDSSDEESGNDFGEYLQVDAEIGVEEVYENVEIFESNAMKVNAKNSREGAMPLVGDATVPSVLRPPSAPSALSVASAAPCNPVDVVGVAATRGSMTSDRPNATNTPPLQATMNHSGPDTSATAKSWEAVPEISTPVSTVTATEGVAATAHIPERVFGLKEDVNMSPLSPPPVFVVRQAEEASSHRIVVAVPPSLATIEAPVLTNVNTNKEMVNIVTKPVVHEEGMYAQLAHATSPARHDTSPTRSSLSSEGESVHTGAGTRPVGLPSAPPSSSESAPDDYRTGINSSQGSRTINAEPDSHNVQTFSVREAVEEGNEAEEEVEEDVVAFEDSALQDTITTHRILSDPQPLAASALPSLPELPVPAGMYGQLAHSSTPVRPVSVPITVSSGNDSAAAKTKTLKSTRWSWLRKKST